MLVSICSTLLLTVAVAQQTPEGAISEPFPQEVPTVYTPASDLPCGLSEASLSSIGILDDGRVYAPLVYRPSDNEGGTMGHLFFENGRWRNVDATGRNTPAGVYDTLSGSGVARNHQNEWIVDFVRVDDSLTYSASKSSVYRSGNHERTRVFSPPRPIFAIAANERGELYVGTEAGLFGRGAPDEPMEPIYPAGETYSWAPRNVTALAFDEEGRLWFGCSQGAGVFDGDTWKLYTGAEGLPYGHFTCAASGDDGSIWFGTQRGAIRFDGDGWSEHEGTFYLLPYYLGRYHGFLN